MEIKGALLVMTTDKLFKRDAYKEMLEWKKMRNLKSGHGAHALEIIGPRQCGKTTLINQFAVENYKHVVNIHLGDDAHQEKRNAWRKRAEKWAEKSIVPNKHDINTSTFITY